MDHNESKEHRLFIDIIKHMIEKRGIKVTSSQLARLLSFVETCCPWFPKDGSLDIRHGIE